MPGSGGVDRGRGDAVIVWGDESNSDGSEFKNVILPNEVLDPSSTDLQGLSFLEPDADPAASSVKGTQKEFNEISGRAVWRRNLSASQRAIVEKYFKD